MHFVNLYVDMDNFQEFLHRNWLEKFLSDSPRGIDFIEKQRNCEDTSMNFLIVHTI